LTLRSLHAVLRSLADDEPPTSDGELLRRFLGGNDGAFAELIRRHGRLVWAVCRNLTGSDAEADDAFQATFLVLLRSAKKVRDSGRLSAWLHGVAYKVCARARQAARLRATRERAAARSEQNGSAVADSAWDRTLAAVHEEAGRLPETLRVPFVLCCLEGKGLTEAAGQLGWKLGTLSGRLSRAKDAILARLDARGLTFGAVAGLRLATPPAAAVAQATALARVGFVVPNSVLQLTHGVLGMNMSSFKVLAAAVLLACGLGLSAGTGWVANAGAQSPVQPPPTKADPQDESKRAIAELLQAQRAAEEAQRAAEAAAQRAQATDIAEELTRLLGAEQNGKGQSSAWKTTKWEYDFVVVSDMTPAKFVEFLQDRENRGWEYNGSTPMPHDGKPSAAWVFRRPVKGAEVRNTTLLENHGYVAPSAARGYSMAPSAKPADARAIEADIARLQKQLATIREKPTQYRVSFPKEDLPLEAAELTEVLRKLAGKKFKNSQFTFTPSAQGVALEGDKEVIEWAVVMIKKLADK
jgi:RNA polymerase sigma factor (sigma-70 family)